MIPLDKNPHIKVLINYEIIMVTNQNLFRLYLLTLTSDPNAMDENCHKMAVVVSNTDTQTMEILRERKNIAKMLTGVSSGRKYVIAEWM